MARDLSTAWWKQTTDAEFRAWGKAMSDAMTAVGIPKTADTGQIDWATVVKPAGASASQGYEIRKFNDALQGSYPIFMKFEWGSAGAATTPQWWVTIGTATDGAGNLTGQVVTRKVYPTAGATSAAYQLRVTGDTNRLLICPNVDAGSVSYGGIFCIERTHDAAGADTNEGFIYLQGPYATANIAQGVFIFGTGMVNQETAAFSALVPMTGTGASGANVAVYPIFCTKGVYLNPFRDVLVVFNANVTTGTQISFTYYGATRYYYPLATTGAACAVRGAVSGTSLLIRDE